jgi:hypothetical protein
MSFVLGVRCRECDAECAEKPFHIDARLQDFDALYDQLTDGFATRATGSDRSA